MMQNANNLFRKYDKTYEILMEYVAKKIDEQDKKNKDFGEKIKIILENNYNNKIKKNNSKNIKKENIKIKDISNDFLIAFVSLIGIIATALIAIFFI